MAEQEEYNWDALDKTVDTSALQDDIKEAANSDFGDFPDIPDGDYEVSVAKMELKKSKKDDPMLSIRFEIQSGEFKGNLIFYNGVMQPDSQWAGLQIHRNNEMLRKIWDADEDEVKFESFSQYNNLILDIAEDIEDNDEWHYKLTQTTNKKNSNFKDLEVIEVLD